jgi:hypothetical protein
MCLVAVSEKPFCLRLSLTETKRVDGVFLEKDELHPRGTDLLSLELFIFLVRKISEIISLFPF